VATSDDVPAEVRRSMELWVGCIAGALSEGDYRNRLTRAGFDDVGIEPTRIYAEGPFMGAFIRARKPSAH
jgi:hypothetical protein